MRKNPFAVLGISREFVKEINYGDNYLKTLYRGLSQKYHSDTSGFNSNNKFIEVQDAMNSLKNKEDFEKYKSSYIKGTKNEHEQISQLSKKLDKNHSSLDSLTNHIYNLNDFAESNQGILVTYFPIFGISNKYRQDENVVLGPNNSIIKLKTRMNIDSEGNKNHHIYGQNRMPNVYFFGLLDREDFKLKFSKPISDYIFSEKKRLNNLYLDDQRSSYETNMHNLEFNIRLIQEVLDDLVVDLANLKPTILGENKRETYPYSLIGLKKGFNDDDSRLLLLGNVLSIDKNRFK